MIVWSIFAHELRWIAKVDFALGGLWSVVITPSIKLFVRLAFCVFLCPFAIGVCHEKTPQWIYFDIEITLMNRMYGSR